MERRQIFPNPRMHQIRAKLDEQGRTLRWLARVAGYSESHLYKLLAGERPETDEIIRTLGDALGLEGTRRMVYRGRSIKVPTPLFKGELPKDVAQDAIEHAWKASWWREHGALVQARVLEAVWQRALEGVDSYGDTVKL